MRDSTQKKLRVVIAILASLLTLSLIALGIILVYTRVMKRVPAEVVIRDNYIEESGSNTPAGSDTSGNTGAGSGTTVELTASLELHSENLGENEPFEVNNMFPGDSETQYFRVRVHYNQKVTVYYRADIRPENGQPAKLGEVLMCRVNLPNDGGVIYDGLMRDMPKGLTHELTAANGGKTVDDLIYEITAYLDTSVGNDYQEKELIADFYWWVEAEEVTPTPSPEPTPTAAPTEAPTEGPTDEPTAEPTKAPTEAPKPTEKPTAGPKPTEKPGPVPPSPVTGDTFNRILWIVAGTSALGLAIIFIILFVKRRKKDDEENEEGKA